MTKKGDTLIEVTLAIGIFSMVAIAITSVVSGSTSSTQAALESTLAREEIDTQAEALRFIQTSYAANKNSKTYRDLWQGIKGQAYAIANSDDEILSFSPQKCSDKFGDNTPNKAFIINPKKRFLVTRNGMYANRFSTSTTYPQLQFSGDKNESLNSGAVKGIYVIAISEKVPATKKPSFYDFYIRTCWYAANANEPSTISTVIRLYDPDAV